MIKKTAPKAVWTKPELVRLGKIADVAGNNGGIIDGISVNPRAS